MKTIKLFFAASLVFALAISITSCSKQDASVAIEETLPGELVAKQPDSGLYKVVRFFDKGENETSLFAGYTFLFDDDGTLTAFLPNQTDAVVGTWALNADETILTITIPGTQALDNIDGDWSLVTLTNKRIGLKNTEPDILLFSKI